MDDLDFTAIVPVHLDSQDRLENVCGVTRYMFKQLKIPNIIVVEWDTSPKLAGLMTDAPGVRYMFVQRRKDEIWSKTRLVNAALPWVRTTCMAIWDADTVISQLQVKTGVSALIDGRCAVIPYQTVYHVPHRHIGAVKAGMVDFAALIRNKAEILYKIEDGSGQACIFFRTDVFRHARGANELFIGWGGEDDEQITRIGKLFGEMVQVHGPLIHISHDRGPTSYSHGKYGSCNEAERQRIYDWSPDQIREYFGITKELCKYCTLDEAEPHTEETKASMERLKRSGHMKPGTPMYADGEGKNKLHAVE